MHTFWVYDKDCHDSRDEAEKIEAASYNAAAEEWAHKIDDSIDYAIADGAAKAVLQIRIDEGDKWEPYVVTGKRVVSYTARRGER